MDAGMYILGSMMVGGFIGLCVSNVFPKRQVTYGLISAGVWAVGLLGLIIFY